MRCRSSDLHTHENEKRTEQRWRRTGHAARAEESTEKKHSGVGQDSRGIRGVGAACCVEEAVSLAGAPLSQRSGGRAEGAGAPRPLLRSAGVASILGLRLPASTAGGPSLTTPPPSSTSYLQTRVHQHVCHSRTSCLQKEPRILRLTSPGDRCFYYSPAHLKFFSIHR